MNKLFLSAFLAVLCVGSAHAQTFTLTRISPNPVYSTVGGSMDITSYFVIHVTTGSSLNIRLVRRNVNTPSGWQTAMCDIHTCYGSNVDTTPYWPYSGNSYDTGSAHFYGDSIAGSGSFTIRAEVQGSSEFHEITVGAVVWPLGIKPISSTVSEFKLNQNYPNPFNPTTKIVFSLPKSDYTDLRIYDILGREVAVLASGFVNAGEYEVEWDARNLSSGIYYYRLKTPDNVAVKKMTLVK